MNRMIRSVDGPKDLKNSLELVDTVFTESEGEEKGKEVRSLVEEIFTWVENTKISYYCLHP